MAGFFRNLGQFLGRQARQARWAFRSLTGDEIKALQAEQAVGRDLAAEVLAEMPADPDPVARQWVEDVGNVLAAALNQPQRRWTFRPLLASEPNGFALPGGYVFVTRPLLRLCSGSHDELAFVLGHEMGHVVCGHAMQRLLAKSLLTLTGGRWNPVGGLLRGVAGSVLGVLLTQGYAQDQELEADTFGLRLSLAAGFDGQASVSLFERLRLLLSEPGAVAGYFSSHPSWESRISRLRETLGS